MRLRTLDYASWLAPYDSSLYHSDLASIASLGSGHWALNALSSFAKSSDEVLWLQGDSGTGKTILISLMIEHLRRVPSIVNLPLLYVDDPGLAGSCQHPRKLCHPVVVWPSRNLGNDSSNLKDKVAQQRQRSSGRLNTDELIDLLESCLMNVPGVYIVLDAPNEMSDSGELLSALSTAMNASKSCKLVVASTMDLKLDGRFPHQTCQKVYMKMSNVDHDIASFVDHELSENPRLNRLPQHVQENIRVAVLQGAHGS